MKVGEFSLASDKFATILRDERVPYYLQKILFYSLQVIKSMIEWVLIEYLVVPEIKFPWLNQVADIFGSEYDSLRLKVGS